MQPLTDHALDPPGVRGAESDETTATAEADSRTLLLALEEAEAEAEAAEAAAEAARARAHAARLRRHAASVTSAPKGRREADTGNGRTKSVAAEATTTDDVAEPAPTDRADSAEIASLESEAASELSSDTPPGDAVTDSETGTEDADTAARSDIPTATTETAAGTDSVGITLEKTTAVPSDDIALADPETATAAPLPTDSRDTTFRRRIAVVTAAVALVVVALAASGFFVWNHHTASEEHRRTAEFSAAARQGVVALTTLDFNRAAEDVQRVLDNSTGSFREDFSSRADDFTNVIRQSQVATEGTVNGVAVESMTDDTAVVLVAATSRVTNSAGAEQEPRAWRLSVTVTRVDGQIKMSKVEFVP
ncbi:hypothetical protein [Nocardia noduli]|uniref:hypothetical protein n=1 Tax=Nocardia noduli TaxID=2815722 RepID=UPI001C23F0D1|nr:hypothetical protein [Nocardia noduli]